jgi:hypothetical protein
MTSIKHQLFLALKNDPGLIALGFTWYGDDSDDQYSMPPPSSNPPAPWGHLQFADSFPALPGDTRQIVSITLGDEERRQYRRINAGIIRCHVIFARRPETRYVDEDTTEMWWFPEPAGIIRETEDPDRPGYLIRAVDFMFRTAVGAAAVVSGS